MHLLVIGPDDVALTFGSAVAAQRGTAFTRVASVAAGIARLREEGRFDIVICDIDGDPDSVGRLGSAMASERIALPVVACGSRLDPVAAGRAIRDGAREFIALPPDAEAIAAILTGLVERSDPMVAVDPRMRQLLRQAEKIAASEATVLICGESGTGKEVMARYLHRHSRRAPAAFVAINCAAIPEALLESELFGHEKGAFSGAVARRIGKFEAASGGTLLLDEISEMDLRLQAKLLRAIQEREIDRLGGSGPVRVDTRIIATTNRDLADEVAAGRFRADLYFRLDVVNLRLPALRERPGDIGPLAHHYAQHYASLNGLEPRRLAPSALQALARHAWPGNIRELQNLVHRAVLLAEGEEIDADALGLTSATAVTAPMPVHNLVGQTVGGLEQKLIIETLHHTLGNRTHAATLLGISIRALRNKLRDYAAQGVRVPSPEMRSA
ncbi:DNA-binding NtrC family response regulator [Endobacter medicaginis]|uniref:DNA-binding NtrC family response regulator n=1 Tax=Endobacter medicaginis TaxID=1181271 RepID=A0A839V5F6_9PROT|nr:sigma-54 dependent transcriptional regulator [Endobacter medicaginis]MBB3174769.1 DNA-binding NtrC family response regulator [Endobacter medicaginis]MCX5475829.1 sigma-54 dependent transcriptional regulator [Endobacter medicaginis]NVN29864.1 sigma-54-dependent Fis family transcriptional regulator [Endobacter medicaginis]